MSLNQKNEITPFLLLFELNSKFAGEGGGSKSRDPTRGRFIRFMREIPVDNELCIDSYSSLWTWVRVPLSESEMECEAYFLDKQKLLCLKFIFVRLNHV